MEFLRADLASTIFQVLGLASLQQEVAYSASDVGMC